MLVAEKQAMVKPVSPIVVKQSRPVTGKRKNSGVFFKVGGAVFCLMIINILLQAIVIQKNYEVRAWEAKNRDLNREMVEVRMDIAELESFDRIKTIAENDLGMREAGSSDYRCIAVNQSLTKQPLTQDNSKNSPRASLWAKVSSWVGSFGATMAQNP